MSDAPKDPETEPLASSGASIGYRVELPSFEGPLDLLLHLIQQHELDIMDIPIAFIAEKYVHYITLMQELNIDLASEYLVMAATLTHIKSKMLLPTPPDDQDDADGELDLDPRAELVRRLLEYQKYKQAAAELGDRDVLGRDVFLRGLKAPSVDGPAPLAQLGLFTLLDAFQAVLNRAKTTVDHQIDFERFSITDRINQLVDVLKSRPRLAFEELFEGQQSRADLIVTFLALLEMTRLRLTKLEQLGPLEPITVELAVTDDEADERLASEHASFDEDYVPIRAREAEAARPDDSESDFGSEAAWDGDEVDEPEPETLEEPEPTTLPRAGQLDAEPPTVPAIAAPESEPTTLPRGVEPEVASVPTSSADTWRDGAPTDPEPARETPPDDDSHETAAPERE